MSNLEQETKIEFLYHSGYWDGPLSGACLYQGERLWFSNVHDYHSKTEEGKDLDMRIYSLHRLTPKEWEDEDYWHGLFEKHVGTHTSYINGQRSGKVHSSKTHNLFYDASNKAREENTRQPKVLDENNRVGYFDRSEMKFRKTKYRNYWLEGESPYSVHSMDPHICANYELVEWRNDAQKWDHFDSDFDGKTTGWAICIQPDGPETGKAFWIIIDNCPWCGKRLAE